MVSSRVKALAITLGFFFCFLASTGQRLGFQLERNRKRVTIAVEIINNLVVVPVVLNDLIPLKFILDTGVRTTIITKKEYIDLLGLSYSRKYTVYGLGNKRSIDAFVTNNVSLRMPGVYGVGHSVLALKEDYLKLENYLGTAVHGILGYELFSRFIVQINYTQKTLTLLTHEKFKAKKRSEQLPMVIRDTKPYIHVDIETDNKCKFTANMLIDTGASHGVILEPNSSDSIRVPAKNINGIIGRGLGGVITGKVGRIRSLTLGRYSVEHPLVHFPDTSTYTHSLLYAENAFRNGSLGGETLKRFNVVFDFARESIYLKRRLFHKKTNYNMSGISINATGDDLDEYKIVYLTPKSPGLLAGLQVGDRILSINGYSNLSLNKINDALSSRAGRRILLTIERGKKQMRVALRLVDMI